MLFVLWNRSTIMLAIHLVWSSIRRRRISRIHVAVAVLLQLLNTAGWSLVLTRNLRSRLIADWWQLNLSSSSLLVARRRLVAVVGAWAIRGLGLSSASTILLGLALGVLLLLSRLPFLADLLEFFWSAFLAM
jgi:hypothetical protein